MTHLCEDLYAVSPLPYRCIVALSYQCLLSVSEVKILSVKRSSVLQRGDAAVARLFKLEKSHLVEISFYVAGL